MKTVGTDKKSKDKQTIIKKIESLFVRVSFNLQHIIFKHPFIIILYFFIQTLFQVILPSFAATAILAQKLSSETLLMVANFSKLLFIELLSFSSDRQAFIIIIQTFILIIIVGLSTFLRSKQKKFLKLALYILTLIDCTSSFLLNIQYQFFSALQISENVTTSKIGSTIIIINIIIILLMDIFYKFVGHTYSFSQTNQLLPKFSIGDIILELVKKLSGILIYIDLKQKTGILSTIYLSLMFIITLIRLYNQITFYTYLSEKTTLIYHKILTIQSSTLFTTLLLIITSAELLAHNYIIQIIVLFMFSSFAMSRLMQWREVYYQMLTEKQIQSESQAILYVIQTNRLIKKVKTKPAEGLILVSMVKQHQQKCTDINCECKTGKNESKNKYFSCETLVYSLTQRLCEKYKNENFSILSLYIRLTIHDNFTARLVLKKSKFLSGNSQNYHFFTRIMLQKYSQLIHQYIKQKQNFLGVTQTQKSFQSDNNIQRLLSKIVQVSKCRQQFWKFFKKGAIIRKQFQDLCQKQLQRMKQINKIKNEILTEFSNDLVLTSFIIAYEKFVLLKDRPSKKLNQCLEKQRILSHSSTRKIDNQQGKIEKFLHSSWVCSLQCSLQPEEFGNITRASSNSLAILSYPPQSLLNCNISLIIPKTIQKQHTELMLDWYKKCSWANIGKLRQVYCVDKKNISFSSKIYLKVTHRLGDNSGVNLMATIFKENENDFVILDEKQCIIGIGQTFMNLFGQIIIGLPFQFICPDAVIGNLCTLLEEQEQKKIYRSSFYSTSKIIHLLKGYHQKNYDMKYTSKQLLLQKLRQEQRNLSESQITVIQYELKPYKVGKVYLIVFKIVNIVSNNLHLDNKKELFQSRHIANLQQQNSSKDNFKKQQQIQEQICFTPSVASSSASSTSPFQMNVDQLQSVFYGYFYRQATTSSTSKPTNIMDKKLIKLVIIIMFFSVSGIFICSVKLFFNYKGFQQIRGLFFGDGACSDNLQLSMFIYNKAVNLYDSTKYPINGTSQQNIYYELNNRYEQQYLQSLIKSEIFKVSQQLSNLTNTPIYGYQNILTTWTNIDRSEIKIQTIKFINNFLYFVDRICKLTEDIMIKEQLNITANLKRKTYIRSEKLNLQLQDKMKTLYFNFPTLYQLNTDYLNYYTDLFLSCRDKIKLIGYIKISSSLLLTLFILAFLYYHYYFRNYQIEGIYEEFSKVDRETVQTLFEYYREVSNGIENRDKFLHNNKNKTNILSNNQFATSKFISISKLHEQKISTRFNPTGSTKIITKRHSLFLPDLSMLVKRVIFFIVMILIGMLNLSMITTQSAILDTSGKMMEDINGLMNSQNQLIGAYFTLKGQYVINGRKFHYDQEEKKLMQIFVTQVNKIETQFNRVAVGSLNTFSQYDPQYVSKMIHILAQSICQLIKEQVPSTVHTECIENQQIKMVQKGVINAMTYFGRTVQQNIILYTNVLEQIPMFPKIDKSLLYMFKIYQKTQSQIVDSLVVAVKNQNIQYLLYITAELIFFSGCVAYMIYFFNKQNNQSVSRLGRILLLPIKYIKSNKNIMRNFEKVCDVTNLNH